MSKEWTVELMREIGSCPDGFEWVEQQKTQQQAWDDCQRGDWMLWFLGATSAGDAWSEQRKVLTHVVVDCLEAIEDFFPAGEERPRQLSSALRKWAEGTGSASEVKSAGLRVSEYFAGLSESREAVAAAAARYAALVPAYSGDIAAAMGRLMEFSAKATDGYMKMGVAGMYLLMAQAIRKRFPSPPEPAVRKYDIECGEPACDFCETVVVSDPYRNGWAFARLVATMKHDFFHGRTRGLVNPPIRIAERRD